MSAPPTTEARDASGESSRPTTLAELERELEDANEALDAAEMLLRRATERVRRADARVVAASGVVWRVMDDMLPADSSFADIEQELRDANEALDAARAAQRRAGQRAWLANARVLAVMKAVSEFVSGMRKRTA